MEEDIFYIDRGAWTDGRGGLGIIICAGDDESDALPAMFYVNSLAYVIGPQQYGLVLGMSTSVGHLLCSCHSVCHTYNENMAYVETYVSLIASHGCREECWARYLVHCQPRYCFA